MLKVLRPMASNCDAHPIVTTYGRDALDWSGGTDSVRPARGWYLTCKTAAEFLVALGLVVATAPVILLGALLVKLTSRGPAVYRQTRLGLGGQPFTILKLRSMYQDCERHTGACWARKCDPRVTPVGRVLRFTHLDELPQLINVLRGEMSLIGPRPERPEIVPRLEREIPRYGERVVVRPGLTGLAQVSTPADMELECVRRKLAYDLYYIEALSPWLDLRIIVGTVLKVFGASFPLIRRLARLPSRAEVEGSAQPRHRARPAPAAQPA
jgi:lipopolysaccharide/colanic/teichoic acid biosynthesis glycosyltransferase